MNKFSDLCILQFLLVTTCLWTQTLAVSKTPKVKNLGGFDAFVTTQAETFNSGSGVQIEECYDDHGGQQVGFINDGDWMVFYGVDFQYGALRVDLRVATNFDFSTLGYINLRLDSVAAYPLVTFITRNTTDHEWTTLSSYLEEAPSGVHDLYFTFTSEDASANIVEFNWFQFNRN